MGTGKTRYISVLHTVSVRCQYAHNTSCGYHRIAADMQRIDWVCIEDVLRIYHGCIAYENRISSAIKFLCSSISWERKEIPLRIISEHVRMSGEWYQHVLRILRKFTGWKQILSAMHTLFILKARVTRSLVTFIIACICSETVSPCLSH